MFFLDLNPKWGATFCAATVGLGRASVGNSAGGPLPEGGHAGGIAGPQAPERMEDVGPWPQLEGGKVMVEAFLVKFIAACGRGGIDQSQRLDKLKALLGFATRCDHDVLTALPGGLPANRYLQWDELGQHIIIEVQLPRHPKNAGFVADGPIDLLPATTSGTRMRRNSLLRASPLTFAVTCNSRNLRTNPQKQTLLL
jgi:hypothetical protein